MKFTNRCQLNGKTYTMNLNCTEEQLDKGYLAYANGALLQDAFSFLNADEREFLKTGTPPEVWDEMLGEGETFKFAPGEMVDSYRDGYISGQTTD